MEIAALTGLSYPTVRKATGKAIDQFAERGWAATKPAAQGSSAGDRRLLSAEQEAPMGRTIATRGLSS